MATQISSEARNGNLHIHIQGACSGDTPDMLVASIRQFSPHQGNIFIHTSGVTEITCDYRQRHSQVYAKLTPTREKIYIIGAQGIELAIPCNKVIVPPARKARCSGCTKCSCGTRNHSCERCKSRAKTGYAEAGC